MGFPVAVSRFESRKLWTSRLWWAALFQRMFRFLWLDRGMIAGERVLCKKKKNFNNTFLIFIIVENQQALFFCVKWNFSYINNFLKIYSFLYLYCHKSHLALHLPPPRVDRLALQLCPPLTPSTDTKQRPTTLASKKMYQNRNIFKLGQLYLKLCKSLKKEKFFLDVRNDNCP